MEVTLNRTVPAAVSSCTGDFVLQMSLVINREGNKIRNKSEDLPNTKTIAFGKKSEREEIYLS